MAQIWLTYSELADFMKLSTRQVEAATAAAKWDRRLSRDGATRVKLPPSVALDYMIVVVGDHTANSASGFAESELSRRSRPIDGIAD